ncbi:MAG: hypothetical protein M3286_03665 [Thermoproteota archaeon]|nr:hypothetical protein [Thermoproteota archaeon]
MNRRVSISASVSAVVFARLFLAAGFIDISQRMAFATSSNSDDEDRCMESANKISNDADGHASSNVCEISLARGSPTITLLGQEANDLTDNEFKYQDASA